MDARLSLAGITDTIAVTLRTTYQSRVSFHDLPHAAVDHTFQAQIRALASWIDLIDATMKFRTTRISGTSTIALARRATVATLWRIARPFLHHRMFF
eukprot:3179249-Pyramimonas_sp.AAC.1